MAQLGNRENQILSKEWGVHAPKRKGPSGHRTRKFSKRLVAKRRRVQGRLLIEGVQSNEPFI
jgi:hypothetical protein